MPNLKSWLQSSTDPQSVSNSVKGGVLAASSIIILIATQLFGITLTANDIASLATEIGVLAGGMWAGYGLVMKIVVWIGSHKY